MLVFATACNHDPDEIVVPSTTPEITAHSDVVVNNNTENETFTLAWTPAKYGVETDVEYSVYAKHGDTKALLGTTDLRQFSMTNGDVLKAVGIDVIGSYSLTFSLEALSATGEKRVAEDVTIKFKYDKVAYIWVPGDYQKFAPEKAPRLLQRSNKHFYGYVNLEGTGKMKFKFTSQPSWDGTNYGKGDADGKLSTDGGAAENELEAGLYYFDVNLVDLTYTAVPLTRVGVIGAMNNWSAPDIQMHYNASTKTWVAITKVSKGQEYKVRFNNVWDVPVGSEAWNLSLGGTADNLEVANNTNLQVASADGIIAFSLSLTDYPYTIKESKVVETGTQLYAPSSDNGWDYITAPILRQDKTTAGVYNGAVDFTANAQFLFAALRTPYGSQYGGALTSLVKYTDGGATPVKLSLPAGKYYMKVDLNASNVTYSAIESVTIADAAGVNSVSLTYDATSHTWKGTKALATDIFYRIDVRAGGVSHLLGGSVRDLVQDDDELYVKAGNRTFEVSLGRNFSNTLKIDGILQDFVLYPASIGVTGDFSDVNWKPENSPQLPGNVKTGIYKGYLAMYGATYGFKFTYGDVWAAGVAAADGANGEKNFTIGTGDNMSIPAGLYYWTVDLSKSTASALPLTRVGVIGDATPTGWDSDTEMTRDAADGLYKLTIALTKATIKVRFNNGWTYSLGGDPTVGGCRAAAFAHGALAVCSGAGDANPLAPGAHGRGSFRKPEGVYFFNASLGWHSAQATGPAPFCA